MKWLALLLMTGCSVPSAPPVPVVVERTAKVFVAPKPVVPRVFRLGNVWPGCFVIQTSTNLADWQPYPWDTFTNNEPCRFFRTCPVWCSRENPVFADEFFTGLPYRCDTTIQ